MSSRDASIATRRFGLGPRAGDVARIAGDPRGYVFAQLARADGALIDEPGLQSSAANFTALQDAQFVEQLARQMAKQDAPKPNPADEAAAKQTPPARPAEIRRDIFIEEATARLRRAATTDQPLIERLVMFWSNHFAISATKGAGVRVMAGAFEREAIRPHVLGRFGDMLKAVEQHPAMLIYLDNAQSIGPGSRAGINRNKGLNENLAREILELHTLGVGGGYSQADVTSFANVLTGWSTTDARMVLAAHASGRGDLDIMAGQFVFLPNRHEPGEQTVLGKSYPNTGSANGGAPKGGLARGELVLADLARHPSTAHHIATKLAAHFVGQSPPPALIGRLEATFKTTNGDLREVAKTLVQSDECWQAPPRKVVPPYDFTVALMRAFALTQPQVEALRVSAAIGQPLWQPPSPKGWPDDDDAWMGPSAIRERLRIAERVARLVIADGRADPRWVAEDLFGQALSREAAQAIERAEAREQGFELLIMSPEFLRR